MYPRPTVLLLLASFQLVRVASSYSLTISPDHVRTSKWPQSVSITCTADRPLTGCQFRWRDYHDRTGPLLDLSRGSESQVNSTHLGSSLSDYSYSGQGLGSGDCGVSLQVKGVKRWIVACRVRAETGGWTYAWADLYTDVGKPLPHSRTPRESVVLPGGEARFTLKAREPHYRCRFYPLGVNLDFGQGAQSNHSTGRYRYLGGGLGLGQCGLALSNVSEADNGPIWSYVLNTAAIKSDCRFMALIVARRPTAPSLAVVLEKNSIIATCRVEDGRPLPQITWLLGEDIIRQDSLDDSPGSPLDEWRWPWMGGSRVQTVTLRPKPEDNGQRLKCRVSHVTLHQPLEVNERIFIKSVASYNLRISPDRVHTAPTAQSVSYTCTADTVLTGCQFIWRDWNGDAGPLLDLSQGSESQVNSTYLNSQLTGYSYSGRGLGAGDCGITLQVEGYKHWMVACRVRAETGGWTYAWGELYVNGDEHIPHTLTPRESVVLPGAEARFAMKAQNSLIQCRFHPNAFPSLDFDQGAESDDSTGQYRYLGGGLGGGECGLAVSNVTEADNGPITSHIGNTEGDKFEHRSMLLIVARPPTAPSLTVVQDKNRIDAKCRVEDSRPPPHMTWLLGDDVLRQDSLDDSPWSPLDGWRWSWTQGSLVQTVTLRPRPEDHGKSLKCRISHVTLDQPLEVNERILIKTSCPALFTPNATTVACFSEGREVNCTREQTIGSWAVVACKPGYTTSENVTYSRINCTDSAEWDRPVFACHPDCGRRNTNQGELQISGGETARVGEFPWHVAIYEKHNDSFTQICGGSLISTRIVISAAHCFWSEKYTKQKESAYAVAAGKHKRAWRDAEDGDQVQRRLVEVVTIQPRYHGRQSSFQSDIALVRLSAPVDITANVNLVCLDWKNRWEDTQLQHGNKGTVPGWGYTEQGRLSSVLKHVELPYVDHDTCYHALDESLKPLCTLDKFCAGYDNLSISTCRGDSGGGLVFLNESSNRYYLRGLASIAFKPASSHALCYSELYTAFTLVSPYYKWLKYYGV